MIPRLLCRACGTEIEASDKFCGKCGEKVEWGAIPVSSSSSVEHSPARQQSQTVVCPLCGNRNSGDADVCSSCGAVLSAQRSSRPQKKNSGKQSATSKTSGLKALQSWKVTVGFALLLIVVLVILTQTKKDEPQQSQPAQQNMTPNSEAMLKEIESIEKIIDSNPNDKQAILRLANLLHDVKFTPRAIMMYERYLELEPSNPDVRVDLGICYFELSLNDSVKHEEYSASAAREMEKALTYAPKHQLAHFNLGIVALHDGNMDNALDWFKKCVALGPNTETGRRAQQFLNQHSFNTPSQ